jgi:hypothetical protein
MKDGFFFFENFKNTADTLPDDLRLKFYDALTDYAINGVEPDDTVIKALITAFKPSLDKVEKRGGNHNPTGQNQHSEVKSGQKEVKVGQSGQSFNKQETGNIKQEIITPKNNNSNELIILSPYNGFEKCSCDCERKAKFQINDKKFCGQHTRIELTKLGRLDLLPQEKRFVKPTIEEISLYCRERQNTISAENFFNFYESKGWRVGNQPMKDWKAAVRNWERSYTAKPATKTDKPETNNPFLKILMEEGETF